MIFARPALLLLLVLLPFWWWRRVRRPAPAARYSDVAQLLTARVGRRWLAELPAGLRTLALSAWIVAAAGPELGTASVDSSSEGIAIVLAVDVSSSMLAEDFAPSNRLDVAREQSIAFIRGREFDRIGLVAFAGEALTRVPVTVDYQVLEVAVRELRVGELEDGTAIGTAMGAAAFGGFVLPWLHGTIGDRFGIDVALGSLSGWSIVIAVAALIAYRIR